MSIDERGRALVSTYGNRPNVKTIPYEKPAEVDNVQEVESQNQPRKPFLIAHTSGRGDPKNRPGRRNDLGKYEATELEQDMTMDNNVEATLEKAEQLMDAGELDACERLLDQQISKLSAEIEKSKHKAPPPPPATDEEDDGDEDDLGKALEAEGANEVKVLDSLDATNAAVKLARIANASAAHPLRKRALDATVSQVEADIAKLGSLQPVRYPHGTDTELNDHQNSTHQGTTTVFADRSQCTVTPVVQIPGRHKFDDLVDAVMRRDGGPRSKAMATARLENPSVFTEYQAWHSGNTAQQQQTVQGETSGQLNKAFEAAVDAEIRKGHNPRVAAQRVMNFGIWPNHASIAKANDAYADLREAAEGLLNETDVMPRTSALRKARLANEALYKALNTI